MFARPTAAVGRRSSVDDDGDGDDGDDDVVLVDGTASAVALSHAEACRHGRRKESGSARRPGGAQTVSDDVHPLQHRLLARVHDSDGYSGQRRRDTDRTTVKILTRRGQNMAGDDFFPSTRRATCFEITHAPSVEVFSV